MGEIYEEKPFVASQEQRLIRKNAVNSENLNEYFDLLQEVLQKNNFADHPEAIYNIDETGMQLEPHSPKLVAQKGQKKVRYQTSGQKQQITVCGSAVGRLFLRSLYLLLSSSITCG